MHEACQHYLVIMVQKCAYLHRFCSDADALNELDVLHDARYSSHHDVVLRHGPSQNARYRQGVERGGHEYRTRPRLMSTLFAMTRLRSSPPRVWLKQNTRSCQSSKVRSEPTMRTYSKYFRAMGIILHAPVEKCLVISSLILRGCDDSTTRISTGYAAGAVIRRISPSTRHLYLYVTS